MLEIPPCFYRISVKALILDSSRTKFLIVQEDNGKWELPGGGMDWGESPQDTLRREILEEMGLEVSWIDTRPAYFISGVKNSTGSYDIANVLYETKVASLEFTPSDECIATSFVAPEEAHLLITYPNLRAFAEVFTPEYHRVPITL